LSATLLLTGCQKEKPANEIARVGEVSIRQATFQALLDLRANGDTNRFATPEAKQALLDELIRREAIYAKAKAAGFDQRPDVQDSVKRLIASKFQQEQMGTQTEEDLAVSDAEIQQYYADNSDKYMVPAKSHGAILFIKISPRADADKRQELMDKAQALLDQAKAASPDDFTQLVVNNSDDQGSRYRGGDIGWLSHKPGASILDSAVQDALFALREPGEFAPLVAVRNGVYIVKLLDFKPAGSRPLAEVKDAIAYRLRQKKQEQHEEQFYSAMKAGLDIRVNNPLLDSMQPASRGPSKPPATPGAIAQE
jgi:parvulin-like peptidyl-prolyl isomerase